MLFMCALYYCTITTNYYDYFLIVISCWPLVLLKVYDDVVLGRCVLLGSRCCLYPRGVGIVPSSALFLSLTHTQYAALCRWNRVLNGR